MGGHTVVTAIVLPMVFIGASIFHNRTDSVIEEKEVGIPLSISSAASMVVWISALASACTRTPSGLRFATIAMVVGSVIAFLAQIAAMSAGINAFGSGIRWMEFYWVNWLTELLFWTSLLSVGLSIGSLRKL